MTESTAAPRNDTAPPRRLVVIYNPLAGRGHRRRFAATVAALRGLGCAIEACETQAPGHGEDLARGLDPGACDVVVAAGGDGTINEVINGLTDRGRRRSPLPLAVLPLGTANVLAAELGLETSPAALARTIAAGPTRTVCLGCANGRVFAAMAGVGFDAHVVAGVDQALKRRLGKGAYLWRAFRLLSSFAYPVFRVALDGTACEAAAVIVAKGRFYAGRFICAPRADLREGSFQVCLFEKAGAWNTLRYAAALGLGRLSRLPDVRVVTAFQVEIDGPPGDPVQGDGDVITHLPVTIEVLSGVLELVVPPP